MFDYDWNWGVIWLYRGAFLEGLLLAALLTLVSIVVGTLTGLGLGIGLARMSGPLQLVRLPLLVFVDAVKALPPLILLLVFYYSLPYVTRAPSPFWLAAIALSVNLCAFIADVFRHAI